MPKTFNQGILHTSSSCQWCGMNQKSPTVFSGLIRLKDEYVDHYYDDMEIEYNMFEITICQTCFKEMFNNSYDEMITVLQENFKDDLNGFN